MTGTGAVLSGLYIPHEVVINASSVTVKDVQVAVSGDFGIALTHTKNVTIENSTISGLNSTIGRVSSAIDDVYGDSTGIVIKANNISSFKTAIQISRPGWPTPTTSTTPATSAAITPTASSPTAAPGR